VELDFDGEELGELLLKLSDPLAAFGVIDTGERVITAEPRTSYTSSPYMIDADGIGIDDVLACRARHRNTSDRE
jgi:hypothetical protein